MSANAASALADSDELENLFDTISAQREPDAPALGDSNELEDLFDSIAVAARAPAVTAVGAPAVVCTPACEESGAAAPGCAKVLNSVGQLTRQLHDTLAELGYDRHLHEAAAATLPDARQRLAYVVTMTEQAASRCLNAVEAASPVQESLASDAHTLAGQWDAVFRGESDVERFKALAASTRDYLKSVPAHTEATRSHLNEIVMAQEFQDLTGQVLKRITELANHLETQLLKLLVENVAAPIAKTEALGLLNGPAVAGAADVVANQAQVDELLESLGF